MGSPNVLETVLISKSYPGVQALDAVSLDLKRGEVHALVGQNGAGKSTFIEIVAGSIRPDSGTILIDGASFPYLGPAQSIELGVQTVHQENPLVEELTVAENVFLHDLPLNTAGFVNQAGCVAATEKLLDTLGIRLAPRKKVKRLTFIEKKLVSIARAFSRRAKILILDEPTASLDDSGRKALFQIMRRFTDGGGGVIYISHNLGEIFEVCHRVTVFKDGRRVETHPIGKVGTDQIVHEMIGQTSSSLYSRRRQAAPAATPVGLSVIDYARSGVVDHVSFDVRAGEIFGLGGLVGAGRSELARMIFGLDGKDSGRLLRSGADITPRDPHDAIRKGLGFLTEDRKSDGLVLCRPVFENISVAHLAKGRGLFLNRARDKVQTGGMSTRLSIKTPSVERRVSSLSGGNQQKVVLGKWLFARSEILIFDEPTVGVDVGAKSEIYRMIDELAGEGKIIIMISSDNPELVAMCDRVGVMLEGRLVTVLEGGQVTEQNILRYSMGIGTGGNAT